MYCVDPRDGFAKFVFCRSKRPGYNDPTMPREVYTTLTIKVDATADPFLERLNGIVRIDQDLVVSVTIRSTLVDDTATAEIHDLEFGLGLKTPEIPAPDIETNGRRRRSRGVSSRRNLDFGTQEAGAICIRSNVCRENDPRMIPGDIVEAYVVGYFSEGGLGYTESHQIKERNYYRPCASCGRLSHEISVNGCSRLGCVTGAQATTTKFN